MPVVVEDGSGVADATSYVSEADAAAYFQRRGVEAWLDADPEEQEAALVRATAGLDTLYRGRWQGQKMHATQALAWPRSERLGEDLPLTDMDGVPVPTDMVPLAVRNAACEVALIELSERFVGEPIRRSDMIKRKKTDVLETEWFEGAERLAGGAKYPHIDQMLAGLVVGGGQVSINFDLLLTEREALQGAGYDLLSDPRYVNRK